MVNNRIPAVFTAKYWSGAAAEFRSLRTLVFAALTVATGAVLNAFFVIPVGLNLHISVAFLIVGVGSMVCGPAVGLAAGMLYDVTGYLLMPSGPFFPGYTLGAMLEFSIYALFFYRSRITVLRILIAKFIVDFGVHVGLGCLWSSILYGKGYLFFFYKSLVKNAILLPVEVALLAALFQICVPILARRGVVPKPKGRIIPLF